MITFSFRPSSGSDLPPIAASVSTRVVSWNDAADSHESVASDAFVMPSSTGRADAGVAAALDHLGVRLLEAPAVDQVARQERPCPPAR